MNLLLMAAVAVYVALLPATAGACTRVLYEAGDGAQLVGRSMDWFEDTGTDLWAFPRGMKRDGGTGEDALAWTSRYGSVVATIYDAATVDGMNEAGLVANALYLTEADYGEARRADKPGLSVGAWLQYILDNFATVEEAVAHLREDPFRIVAPTLPGGKAASGHAALSDPTGDSAIIEYLDGELVIHHGPQYRVMTNSPPYDEQLAIDAYWKQIGGMTMLPGTNRAADRFARASFYVGAVPPSDDRRRSTAAVFSIMRTVSVPLGIADPERPNIASTIWRTVADTEARRYYYESSLSPTVFWVDLDRLDFSQGEPVRKLELGTAPALAGETSAAFAPAEPFAFLAH